jgi:GNAT superfamily N-acetyltransferase
VSAAIRAARAEDDAAAMVGLNGQLGYPTEEPELRRRLEAALASDRHRVLVAVDADDRPIAWVHVAVELLLEASDVAIIRGLVVDEAHRSSGIGAELLRAAEAWARDQGCRRMTVRSRVARERAHRFYEREGYVLEKTSHVFRKPLVIEG